MSYRLLAAIGITAYLMLLVATLPATMLDAALAHASNGRLRMVQAEGTLWSGSAQIEILDARQRTSIAIPMSWRVSLRTLWRAQLGCEIELDRSGRYIPVTLSRNALKLSGADLNVSAAVFGIALPQVAPLALGGTLLAHISSLEVTRTDIRTDAHIQWRDASSALVRVVPLGNYQAQVGNSPPGLTLTLHTLQGPLQIEGKGAWNPGMRASFAGSATTPLEHRAALSPLLRLIASENTDGSFALQYH